MTEDHELNRLLNRLIDGSLEAEEFERAQDILRHDPVARQVYYDLLGIDMLLAEQYEVPDHIAIHSQAMDNSWAVRRARRGMFGWSLAGAAAVVMVTLATFFLFKTRPPEITLAASADSHFRINGESRSGGVLEPGESLVLDHGVVALDLGPYVEACVDGPAELRLMDPEGNIELRRGSAFFQISPGGRGFEVHTPAGVIRDIGTKFGVRVLESGEIETHVTSGAVEIDRGDGGTPYRVNAGEAVKWTRQVPIRRTLIDANLFVQSLPWQHVVFSEDFNDEDGTLLSGKSPDQGWPWRVLMEGSPTVVARGMIDTSFGPRTLSAGFLNEPSSGRRRVYLATVTTAVPENLEDKAHHADAAENVTLWNAEGEALVSLAATSTDGHRWYLADERSGLASRGTRISALEAHTLTLSYERDTGIVRLFEGPETRGPLIDQLKVRSGQSPVSLTISNAQGGDIAIDSLEVRVVAYPQESRSGD